MPSFTPPPPASPKELVNHPAPYNNNNNNNNKLQRVKHQRKRQKSKVFKVKCLLYTCLCEQTTSPVDRLGLLALSSTQLTSHYLDV